MESYKDLEVWKKAISLVTDIYEITHSFPREEKYVLASQIQRAAISVPANIAEGWSRGTTKEYIHFLKVSRGSLAELDTFVIIAQKINYISSDSSDRLEADIKTLGKMINNLINSLQSPKHSGLK